jgi:regulator of protease activity HflC (stomatin/prohibitin superfamily)
VLQAEGAAQARLKAASAEATAIAQIASAIGDRGQTAQYLITARYIESLREMAQTNNSKVIFMPTETSGVLASVGAFKEVFAATGENSEPTNNRLQQPPKSPKELER